jgi:hypothetical protein
MLPFSPDDYDGKGQLRLPLAFWAILLLQARTWVLFVMAGASRQQGSALLSLFYPDSGAFWLGLGLGVPAALGLLLTGYRQRLPRLWQSWRWVLCASLLLSVALIVWQSWQEGDLATPALWLPACFDLLALCWLLLSQRLKACFDADLNRPE